MSVLRKFLLRLSAISGPLLLLVLFTGTQIAQAYCTAGFGIRASFTTHWAFQCEVPSAFQTKVSSAVSTWNASDKYYYVAHGACPPYAYNWGYTSFNSRGWGTNPGTTVVYTNGDNNLTGASSYFNSDKYWFNSTTEGQSWPAGWYDRLTVALHETGHWMFLNHPSVCGSNHPEAVMEPTLTTKTYLRQDDLAGLAAKGIAD